MYRELKERAFEANLALPRLGLVIYTFGNVSAADRRLGVFAIKPSGVPYDQLTAADMVVLDFAGKVVEGKLRPSSDAPTHAALYRHFDAPGGIVHTHSTFATAWAQALRPIPVYGTTHADHLASEVPCTGLISDAALKRDYETGTGELIVETFRRRGLDPAVTPMVLVGGHGPFTWGEDADQAVYHSRVLEELAEMALLTEAVNSETPVLKSSIIQKHFNRKHGKDAYYGQK
ncbi:MAG: L-ribulose-5-phosphate 4-epimerase [Victivallaceae bacterium]